MDDLITKQIEVYAVITEEDFVKGMQYSDLEIRETIKQPAPSKIVTENYKLIIDIFYRMVQSATEELRN